MVLPVGLIKANQVNSINQKPSSIAHANNQNSILISLKDTLHLVNCFFFMYLIIIF
jgi:hypothetical protein